MNKRTLALIDKVLNIESAYAEPHKGICEPGYDDKLVITANWNNVPGKLFDRLESAGIACEWSDEWIECDECSKIFRCVGDSYSWEMYGHVFDGYAVCGDCLNPDEFYPSMENQPKQAITDVIARKYPPTEHGYTLVQDGYESGFHPGQNANPADILKQALERNPAGRFLFVIDGNGQFDMEFSLYERTSESAE